MVFCGGNPKISSSILLTSWGVIQELDPPRVPGSMGPLGLGLYPHNKHSVRHLPRSTDGRSPVELLTPPTPPAPRGLFVLSY